MLSVLGFLFHLFSIFHSFVTRSALLAAVYLTFLCPISLFVVIRLTLMYFNIEIDLQAALAAEPDNPEAKALLHQRSVTVEKVRRNDSSIFSSHPLHPPRFCSAMVSAFIFSREFLSHPSAHPSAMRLSSVYRICFPLCANCLNLI